MKSVLKSLFFATIILITSCSKDEKPTTKYGKVEFGISIDATINKTKAASETPVPAYVIVSINDSEGNATYTSEKIELYNFNGSYISKPLSLIVGSYSITQFSVIDANNTIIYASPVKNSPKAYLVQHPLPIDFNVTNDETNKVVPEVLLTAGSQPQDFGYTTFSFNIVPTFDFLVSVFEYNNKIENFELTTAQMSVKFDGVEKYIFNLDAKTNKITVNESTGNYILNVYKPGFKTFSDTLSANELKQYFDNPLRVVLQNSTIDDGLVAYYPFDNNSQDVITKWTSTEINTSYVNEGKLGQAISFNGQNSYLRFNKNFDYAERTIAFWFKANSAPDNDIAMMFDNDNVDLNYGLVAFSVGKSNGNVNIFYSVSSIVGSASTTLNSWHYATITFSTSSMVAKYYIDGQLADTKNIPAFRKGDPNISYLVDCAVLGTLYNTSMRFFDGLIDEFKVYNRVLNDSEIISLSNSK